MATDQQTDDLPLGQILRRGVAAAHSVLLGALLLFLLHAPGQILNAVAQSLQAGAIPGPGEEPDPTQVLLYAAAGCSGFLLALAVFFLFPLVLGGILGRVRERLEPTGQPPGPFGAYGRAYYLRLLGSQGLFVLIMIVILIPTIGVSMYLAFQEVAGAMRGVAADGAAVPQPPDPQELARRLFMHPTMLVSIGIASVVLAAVAMVYWVANCIIVSEQEPVMASWRRALRFCRQNFPVVLAVALLTFALGVLISPLSLAGPLGLVKELWVLVALALLYSALIGCCGVLLAGLIMSLYLGRRRPARQPEPELAALP